MTIKTKLFLIAGFFIAAIVLIGSLAYFSLAQIQQFRDAELLITQLQRDSLMLRRHEKDYLNRLNNKYVDKFDVSFATFQSRMDQLQHVSDANQLSLATLPELRQRMESYRQSFHQQVEIRQQLGLNETDGIQGTMRAAAHSTAKELAYYPALHNTLLQMRRREKDFMLRSHPEYIDRFNELANTLDNQLRQTSVAATTRQEASRHLRTYRQQFDQYASVSQSLGLTADQGLRKVLRSAAHEAEAQLTELVETLNPVIASRLQRQITMTAVLTLLTAAATLAFIAWTARSVHTRIRTLGRAMKQLASGNADLSQPIDIQGKDEISALSEDCNSFIGTTFGVVRQLIEQIEQLQQMAIDLSAVIETTGNNSHHQLSSTEQMTTAVAANLEALNEVAMNAATTASATAQARTEASRGHRTTNDCVDTIQALATQVEQSSGAIQQLQQEMGQISRVLDVINDIAEQTNLLALNAAIEAARAGDSGRGFSVVADEVRDLAFRTQSSTDEISAIIDSLEKAVGTAREAMNAGTSQAHEGVNKVTALGDMLLEIEQTVSQIADMSNQIAAATEQQRCAADEIDHNISDVSHATSRTNEDIERLSNTHRLLNDTVGEIQRVCGVFKV